MLESLEVKNRRFPPEFFIFGGSPDIPSIYSVLHETFETSWLPTFLTPERERQRGRSTSDNIF